MVSDAVPVAIGLTLGIAFVIMFSIFAVSSDKAPRESTVIIVENAHDAPNGGYDPQVIEV